VVLTEGIEVGATLEVVVERLAHGGEGVAHADGLVVFVPWTAPGDRAHVEVVERHPRWARARLLAIVEPSPRRIAAPCPVFETCGGCQLQHLSIEDQRAFKALVVADALTRIGGVEGLDPVVCLPAAEPWRYRQRASFTWRWSGRRLELGYRAAALPRGAAERHEIVAIAACPIFDPIGNQVLAPLGEGLRAGLEGRPAAHGRLVVRALEPALVQAGVFAADVEEARRLAETCTAASRIPVTWGRWTPGGPPVLAPGAPRLTARIAYRGLVLRVGLDSFLQSDLGAAERLYDAVLEELEIAPGEAAVDGYAGIGVVACQLGAGGVRVTAVEAHPGAAADLRANAAASGGEIHVLELPAQRVDWGRPRPAAIVINPPRAGCPPVVLEGVTRSTARRLVYVSCEPATLARDVRRLAAAWRVTRLRAYDLFPQTAQVETVARLDRR
jgi:23S rRNA (uracil1939-C5)-methyltransferase